MTNDILQFVAITSRGRAFDINFPLHPETRSPTAVSELVTKLLETISEQAKHRDDVSDGDILQALAMTAAIRGRMLDADPAQIEVLTRLLLDNAWEAVRQANAFTAARA